MVDSFEIIAQQSSSIQESTALRRGCLFCRTGKEESVARRFNGLFPQARAIAPVKVRYRRAGAAAVQENVPLLPGYVFFETAQDLPFEQPLRIDGALRLLTYPSGDWQLKGSDDHFARMLFDVNGVIGLSDACYDEGDRIRVLDGFLKNFEGSIVRVNRRARTAEVRIDFQDRHIMMWLGFELIEAGSGENKDDHRIS